jgi:hypothetical protein
MFSNAKKTFWKVYRTVEPERVYAWRLRRSRRRLIADVDAKYKAEVRSVKPEDREHLEWQHGQDRRIIGDEIDAALSRLIEERARRLGLPLPLHRARVPEENMFYPNWEIGVFGPVLSDNAQADLQKRIRAELMERRAQRAFWWNVAFAAIGTLAAAISAYSAYVANRPC